jgi:uroporphyrinogen decarboxylase
MTSRERVTRAVEFGCPDRIPIRHALLPGAVDNIGRENLARVFERFPSDFEGQSGWYEGTESSPEHQKGEWVDEWGCVWVNIHSGVHGQVKGHPLSDWKALKTYRPPDPGAGDWPELKTRENKEKYLIWPGGGHRLFERMHFLRGYERLLIDIAERRPEVEILRDLVLDHTLKRLERQLEYDFDCISYMDDWGTQAALMIHPKDWRRIFKPAYKKIAGLAHQAGKHLLFHTDGYTMEIIDDFIEVGVDAINPQFSCMNLEELAAKCRGRICVEADIDRQYILPFGTPDEVRENVRKIVELFAAPQGGLIGKGEIGPDVPLANVEAFLETYSEWRSLCY